MEKERQRYRILLKIQLVLLLSKYVGKAVGGRSHVLHFEKVFDLIQDDLHQTGSGFDARPCNMRRDQ